MFNPDAQEDIQILHEIHFGFLYPYRVAGMAEPALRKIERTQRLLCERGIGAILTLTEDDLYGARHRAAGFLHHHEPIDDTEPPSEEGMDRAVAFIDASLAAGIGVAVHCLEGRGRTGTVLGGWLGLKERLDPAAAIRRINDLRYYTVLTPSQQEFLCRYLGGRNGNRGL
jgi:atypical dual specificity phosphatase